MTEEQTTEQPNIAIQDIAFLIQIVEVCSTRGAFRAEELASVGAVYNKVKAFIDANTPAAPAAEQTPKEGTE
jgi:hypothetical protein